MRFALMIEPQQGLSYGDQVAIAKRAEANGFEALFRSDHYASFPGPTGQPTTDAWTVIAGLARETDRIGAGRAGLAGDVPPRRHLRQGRHDRRRDERRTDRGRRRRGLERPRAPAARAAVPSRSSERADAHRGPARDPPRPVGRAGRLVVRRQDRSTIRDALFYPKPVDVPGRPRTPNGGARPSAHRRRLGLATRRPGWPRRCARRVQPDSVAARRSPRRTSPKVDAACAAIGRDPADAGALDDGRRARGTDRRRGPSARAGRCSRRSATTPAATSWLEERRDRWIHGTAEPGPRDGPPLRRGRRRADHAPGLHALGPRHDRRHGRGAGRPGLSPVQPPAAFGRLHVARVVAADRVRVRPARPREPLGQELERGRACRAARRPATRGPAPRRPAAARPASGPGPARRRGRRPGSPRTGDPARPRPRAPGGRGRGARPGRPGRRGRGRAPSTRRSPGGGRGGTSRGRGRPTAATTPPRP